MKHSIKGLFVILAIVMSFFLVQGVWAEEITVTDGTIERIGDGSIDVALDGEIYTFYHIPFDSLQEAGISLAVDEKVTISAYVVTFPNEKTKYIAHSITVGNVIYEWHPNVPKAGTTDLDSARAVLPDCTCDNCNCNCPEDCQDCSCDCICANCTCDGDGDDGPWEKNKEYHYGD
jgi:hypothetical protein